MAQSLPVQRPSKKLGGNVIIKHSYRLLIFFFTALFLPGSFQTNPTLQEMKALASIKGKIPGTIVWSTFRHGTWEIYKMNADGTEKVRLTDDQETNHHPVWSKDGKWIYFQRNDDICRMRPDGSAAQVVLKRGFSFDISEDDSKIVYVAQDDSGDSIRLYHCERHESEEIIPLRLQEFRGKELRFPTLSPDNRWLFFSSSYPRAWSVHRVRLHGTGHSFFDRGCMPQHSSDGRHVAWVYGGAHDIYIGTADGSQKRVFESSIPGRPHCYFPKWSSDGKYIVFAASPTSDRSRGDFEIFIKPVTGGEAVRLTFHPATDAWPDIFLIISPSPKP